MAFGDGGQGEGPREGLGEGLGENGFVECADDAYGWREGFRVFVLTMHIMHAVLVWWQW